MEETEGSNPYQFPELPTEIPILLDTKQTELFRECRHDPSWTDVALCEIRIHPHEAEIFVTDECYLPSSADGFYSLDSVDEGKNMFKCQVGEALAMAMKFRAPILLSTRYLLEVARAAVDRLRDEQVCEEDEQCDLDVESLSKALAQPSPSRSRIAQLLDEIRPFAWYWSEHRGGGPMKDAPLAVFQERYKELGSRPATAW